MRLERIIAFARQRRESSSWEALGPDDDRWEPVLVFAKQGKTIATVFLPQQQRDEVLHCAITGVRGYGADELVVVLDGHAAYGEVAKEIAEEMSGSAMQDECEENGGVHRDGVTDLLFVVHGRKGEDLDIRTFPYSVDYNAGELTWNDHLAETVFNESEGQGVIPEVFKNIFSMRKLEDFITDPDEPMAIALYAILRKVTEDNPEQRYTYVVDCISNYFENEHGATVVKAYKEERDPHEEA